ncbi:UNVERIFIED_CONTAM: protein RRP6-like 2, partial [Sesamum radiatum]
MLMNLRSFQGLTCSMQISTRTEDFIIDTLRLRVQIGPHLREVFKDPTKRKVLHGADRDIVWLQRDFGIYVCNMFDTGQARDQFKDAAGVYFRISGTPGFCGDALNKHHTASCYPHQPCRGSMDFILFFLETCTGNVIRWYAFLGMFDEGIKRVLEVLACGHQTKATQELFLREFFRIIQ